MDGRGKITQLRKVSALRFYGGLCADIVTATRQDSSNAPQCSGLPYPAFPYANHPPSLPTKRC
jgi:hypothetical protein